VHLEALRTRALRHGAVQQQRAMATAAQPTIQDVQEADKLREDDDPRIGVVCPHACHLQRRSKGHLLVAEGCDVGLDAVSKE
jgi:hypothetical protein